MSCRTHCAILISLHAWKKGFPLEACHQKLVNPEALNIHNFESEA